MVIEKIYPIIIEHWLHLPFERFIGYLADNGYNYILGISPEEPQDNECCYFNVWIEKKIENITTKQIVFYSKTYSVFKVRNKFKKPTIEFYYELIEKATYDFALKFNLRTKGTNLSTYKIHKPKLDELRSDIEKTIKIWYENIRNESIKKIPKWNLNFRDLPVIPKHKQWRKDSYTTLEQDISYKLLNNQSISIEEEAIFLELGSFYKELDLKLKVLEYKDFLKEDIEDFKNYLFYAFNYITSVSNKIRVNKTYRLIVNENVIGKNESVTHIDYLKYPSLEKTKNTNKYNRANSPETNSFYSTENIDTALKEIKPDANKLITVGVWEPIDENIKLNSFPISHSSLAININEGVRKATLAFEDLNKFNSQIFMNYMRYYLELLGREFTKEIKFNYEYIISAIFSERIFSQIDQANDCFKYDCIIYPSVGNNYSTNNLAISPKSLDTFFKLKKVIEFEIVQTFYDKESSSMNPEMITLVKFKNYRVTSKILDSGEIKW